MAHRVLRIYPTSGIVRLSKVTRDPVTALKQKASSKKHAVTTEASFTYLRAPKPRNLSSRFGNIMTISDIDAFCAELDSILAAEGFSAPVRGADPGVPVAEYRADFVADPRPQTVADLIAAQRRSAQEKKQFCDPDYDGGQCADGTYPNLHDSQLTKQENEDTPIPGATKSSPTAREDRSSAVYRIASSRPQPSQDLPSTQPLRKPRRVIAQLDRVAVKKT